MSNGNHHRVGRCASRRLVALSVAAFVLALGVVFAGPAQAAHLHAFSHSFGSPGSGDGELALVFPQLREDGYPLTPGSGVAVDEGTGDVYVADTGNHRVDEFESDGTFVRAFGADVGGPGIDVCSADCAPGTSGHLPGELEAPTFIAVDNAPSSPSVGDVYVADTATGEDLVTKFDAEGHLISSWGSGGQQGGEALPGGSFLAIQGIGVDTSGNLWVRGGSGGSRFFELEQSGAPAGSRTTRLGTQPSGIALDGASHLYFPDGFPWGPINRLATTA
ncbi:MAG TPA: hypothetical protein VMF55_08075, partial [Solirubrobacterales bacterium]|nr:hypothetical protein [Solirubrobacterales bacterium]